MDEREFTLKLLERLLKFCPEDLKKGLQVTVAVNRFHHQLRNDLNMLPKNKQNIILSYLNNTSSNFSKLKYVGKIIGKHMADLEKIDRDLEHLQDEHKK